MQSKARKSTMADSPTGTMPRPNMDEIRARYESKPTFRSLDEGDADPNSITGIIDLNGEGQDAAKNDDDSPTKSATQG